MAISPEVRRWFPAGVALAAGVFAAAMFAVDGSVVIAAAMLIGMSVLAWLSSPLRRGDHVDHDAARRRAGDNDVIVYWKPGCSYCVRLRWGLSRTERNEVLWVNVWADDAGAAYVQRLQDGDLLTPTAVTGAGERISEPDGERHATVAAGKARLAAR